MIKLSEYWEENKDVFNLWIDKHEPLQASMDILKPLIPIFKKENPTVNIEGCQDCLIDMLIWVRSEAKKDKPTKSK
jgi:hypothetical protein